VGNFDLRAAIAISLKKSLLVVRYVARALAFVDIPARRV
jgi:hypothetical protein